MDSAYGFVALAVVTLLTWVERNFGYATARAYAGHTDSANAGATPWQATEHTRRPNQFLLTSPS